MNEVIKEMGRYPYAQRRSAVELACAGDRSPGHLAEDFIKALDRVGDF